MVELPSSVPCFLEACANLAGEAACRGDVQRPRAIIEKATLVVTLAGSEGV